jgi:hypothetical protein
MRFFFSNVLKGAARVYVSHLSPEFVQSMKDYYHRNEDTMDIETDEKQADNQTDKTLEYYQLWYEIFGESILPFVSTQKELLTNATI